MKVIETTSRSLEYLGFDSPKDYEIFAHGGGVEYSAMELKWYSTEPYPTETQLDEAYVAWEDQQVQEARKVALQPIYLEAMPYIISYIAAQDDAPQELKELQSTVMEGVESASSIIQRECN